MTSSSIFERPITNEEPTPPPPPDREPAAANGTTRPTVDERPERAPLSFDRDAEVALLGAFLNGADPNLAAGDVWTIQRAQAVHAACLRLDDGTRFPLDIRLVASEIGPELEDLTVHLPDDVYATGPAALALLVARGCSVAQAPEFAGIVTEHAHRRRLAESIDRAQAALRSGDTSAAIRVLERAVTSTASGPAGEALPIEGILNIARRVDALPPPAFLAKPVWPSDAYGIVGAESKAGKTWAALDLALAVASRGAWLGQFPCEVDGSVLMFLGEGGERKTIRRLRAIADFYNSPSIEDLPIRICHRVPQLTVPEHVSVIRQELKTHPAALVIVDPLYLAARGAKSSSLFEMAAVLEPVQHACQEAASALVVVHHWNQTGSGKGKERFSGAGSEEWGRVLVSVAVENRTTDEETKETRVTLDWRFAGDEIPDTELRVVRSVLALDPDNLTSPMKYSVTIADQETRATGEEWHGPTQCKSAVAEVFTDAAVTELSQTGVMIEMRNRQLKYRNATIGQCLHQLVQEGVLKVRAGSRNSKVYSLVRGDQLEGVA